MSIPLPAIPTHTHHTEYADPVLRLPSPASSVGTAYGADQTSFSDSEAQLSQAAFERKIEDRMELNAPRDEELRADREPLLMVPAVPGQVPGAPNVKLVRVTERKLEQVEEKVLFDRIMTSLRAEVAQLQENELFEQIILRGSKAALETQPSTNDIDALMRSMMGPSMNIGTSTKPQAYAHLGRANSVGLAQPQPQAPPGAFNFGNGNTRKGSFQSSVLPTQPQSPSEDRNMLSGTTIGGKRSRNGTSRQTRNA
ncbi:hypothetical protein GALMADRAFT_221072 [Galerina marginata CBS 339.88]|uniref:Uncharacterized protein n=1 Tax=Galerina marginata (strain CBS 339.88) TaxID=685588 RepID=A0A067TL84_GALM3|nr:hypothetical protein GALMADRAFT_221072 [Galerina marginata CBS 339.88]